jgi:hypothetical protein
VYERPRPGSYRVIGKGKTSGGPIVAMRGGVVVIDLRELLDEPQARTGVGGRVAPPGYRRTRRRSPCIGATPIAS